MVHYYIKEYFRIDDDSRRLLFAAIAKALMWFSALVSVVCLLGVLGYLLIFNKDSELPIFPYLAMTVFSLPLCGLYSLVQARHRIGRDSISFFKLTTSSGVLSVILSLIFVVFIKWGAFGKLLAPLLSNACVFLFLLVHYKRDIFIPTKKGEYIKIFSFCWPLALSATLGYFTNGFDRTYLETLGNTTEYGIYIVGVSMGQYLTIFGTAISNTFQPDIYETVVKKQWSKYAKVCCMQIGMIAMLVLVFIILAPYVIDILTAGRYTMSTPFAQIISLSTLTSSIYFLINNYTITTNRPKLYLYTSIIGSLIIIIMMPLMVKSFGFYGGAWMSVVSFVGFSMVNVLLLALCKVEVLSKFLNK